MKEEEEEDERGTLVREERGKRKERGFVWGKKKDKEVRK